STTRADGSHVTVAKDVTVEGMLVDQTVTSVSADGKARTVQTDTRGNGFYDHLETARTQIDGTVVTNVTDLNQDGSVRDRRVVTESADGRTKVVRSDTRNSGQFDLTETTVTRIDGTRTVTAVSGGDARYVRSYDAAAHLVSEELTGPDGSHLVATVRHGNLTGGTVTDSQGNTHLISDLNHTLGSAAGSFLGDNSLESQFARSTLIGATGKALATLM